MRILKKTLIRSVTNNLWVCLVFIIVFTLTFLVNFEEPGDRGDLAGTEPNADGGEAGGGAGIRRNVLRYEDRPPGGSVVRTDGVGIADEEGAAVAQDNRLLLVIFTSMKNTTDRDVIQSNTIKNWAQFMPNVQPVVYSTFESGPILNLAERHGWHVHPATRTNKFGTPFLKNMYIHAMNTYDAQYYGFCNGDILFDPGLVSTLRGLDEYKQSLGHHMVIGKRKNYYMKRYTSEMGPLWRSDVVGRVGRKDANFFTNDAEDFFFLSKQHFNWTGMKEVVIGRPAYDNYFVGIARRFGLSVIDATKSILALHQTGKDGKFAGAKNRDARYNKRAIGSFNYHKGTISRASYYETITDLFGRVFLKRSPLGWKQYRKALSAQEAEAQRAEGQEGAAGGTGEPGEWHGKDTDVNSEEGGQAPGEQVEVEPEVEPGENEGAADEAVDGEEDLDTGRDAVD